MFGESPPPLTQNMNEKDGRRITEERYVCLVCNEKFRLKRTFQDHHRNCPLKIIPKKATGKKK